MAIALTTIYIYWHSSSGMAGKEAAVVCVDRASSMMSHSALVKVRRKRCPCIRVRVRIIG